MSIKKVLITGFEPFGREDINPSQEVIASLPDQIENIIVYKKILPVSFQRAITCLDESIEQIKPNGVICLGQAGGRKGITVEKVGINLMEASIPDNDGQMPQDCMIHEDGPSAYFSTLPVKQQVQVLRQAGIEASVSYTAGTYVCNSVLYHLLHIQSTYPEMSQAGFIHVPWLPSQAAQKEGRPACMELDQMIQALNLCIRELFKEGEKSLLLGNYGAIQ